MFLVYVLLSAFSLYIHVLYLLHPSPSPPLWVFSSLMPPPQPAHALLPSPLFPWALRYMASFWGDTSSKVSASLLSMFLVVCVCVCVCVYVGGMIVISGPRKHCGFFLPFDFFFTNTPFFPPTPLLFSGLLLFGISR